MVLAAAGIVLAANAWVAVSVSENRGDARGGTVELTERELHLDSEGGESTAIFLHIEWDSISSRPRDRGAPRWLDAAKLAELGFDCSYPVTRPDARERYGSMTATEVFVVLEHEGEAWKEADPKRERKTRLFAVDAGRDPSRLREKYADAARYIIARGLARAFLYEPDPREGNPPSQPRLQGRIETLFPDEIFVPLPHSKALEGLRGRDEPERDKQEAEPRFAVTVSWGKLYEPWVIGARRLPAGD